MTLVMMMITIVTVMEIVMIMMLWGTKEKKVTISYTIMITRMNKNYDNDENESTDQN